jgi:transcriptional regulator with XRE-family HTH domain
MDAGTLLRTVRSRAGLSQRELARRTGVAQPALSRIERRVVSPSVDTLERLLAACGFELDVVHRPEGDVDRTLITERLRLSPTARVRRAEAEWEGAQALRKAARGGK